MKTTARVVENDASLQQRDFQIRLVDTEELRDQCNKLVNAMYEQRGYGAQSETRESSPCEVTLVAMRDDVAIGTLTICRDSQAGIPADGLYKDHIDAYRRGGATLCEITRFAIAPVHHSKDVLEALFYNAYVHAGICGGVTDVFIEVNPRHVSFYKRLLKFRQIGDEKICERVNAPAILLHRHATCVAQQIAESRERARVDAELARPTLLLRGTRRSVAANGTALAA
jgi:hypothetical protein